MQIYETYKHSGIDWLGEIPSLWEVDIIKYFSTLKARIGFHGLNSNDFNENEEVFCITGTDIKNGTVDFTNAYKVSNYWYEMDSNIQIRNGDVLITKDGTIGKVGVVENLTSKATLNSGVFVLRPKIHSKILYWNLVSNVFKTQVDLISRGSTINHLYERDFKNFFFPIPPIHEQEAIAAFLDEKCGKIDALVEIKSQQIEKLKELRQVKIHQTVTKGLDPNVELKDSGIDWIGGIPKHWEVTNFKRILIGIKDGTHGTHQRVTNGNLLLSAKNIHNNGIRISGDESMIPDKDYHEITKNGYPKKNDLLITCVGTIGRTYVYDLEYPLAFQRSVAFLRFNLYRGNPHYFKFYIESPYYQYILSQLTKTSAQGGVYMGDILKSTIILPPLSEQKNIIAYLDEVTGKIDQAIAQKQEQIEKLKQYKQSLINEVVTGKVKVA